MLKLTKAQRAQIVESFLGNRHGDKGFKAEPVLPEPVLLDLLYRLMIAEETEADQKAAALMLNHCPYVAPEIDDSRYVSWKRTEALLAPLVLEFSKSKIPDTYAEIRRLLGVQA